MQTIKDLNASMPQQGVVQWIGIRPVRKGEVQEVQAVDIDIDNGLSGDHYSKQGGKRMITLIQKEHLNVVGEILNKEIHPTALRRNIVVSGLNLYALQDARFMIGNVMLQGTGFCHPCSRMETNLGPGGYNAMRGHGGITAKVLSKGHIKLTDRVKLVPVVNT